MNAKTVPEIAAAFRALRSRRDRIEGYRPLVVAVTRELATGMAVPRRRIAELADALSVSEETVAEVQRAAEWDEEQLVGIGGLSLRKTPHRLSLDGWTLYTWCSWDALFLVPIIGEAGIVSSKDPARKHPVRITIDRNGIVKKEPPTAVISVVVPHPDAAPVTAAEVQAMFCHFIHFFESADAAQAWAPPERDLVVIEVEEGFHIGQLAYGDLVRMGRV